MPRRLWIRRHISDRVRTSSFGEAGSWAMGCGIRGNGLGEAIKSRRKGTETAEGYYVRTDDGRIVVAFNCAQCYDSGCEVAFSRTKCIT